MVVRKREARRMNQRLIVEQRDGTKTSRGLSDTFYPALNGVSDVTEVGTTTTNITIVGHGLATGDFIVNTTRSNAVREVTVVDADNFTVATVTAQVSGDSVILYKYSTTEVWGSLKGKTGYVDENQQRKIFTLYEVIVRYRTDILKQHSIRIGSRRFEILGIYDFEERNFYLKLQLRELK